MRKKSFMRMMNALVLIQMCLVSILVVVFICFAYNDTMDKQRTELGNYLAVFGTDIDNHITKTDEALTEIVYDNSDLSLLFSEEEAERQYAAINLLHDLQDSIHNVEGADAIIVTQARDELCIDAKRQGINFSQQQQLREFTMEFAREGVQTGTWNLMESEGGIFLFRAWLYRQRAVISFISVDTLLQTIPERLTEKCSFLLADKSGNILCTTGEQTVKTIEDLKGRNIILLGQPIAGDVLEFYVWQDSQEVFRQISSAVVFFFVLLLTLWIFGIYSSSKIRRELLVPMENMTKDMERIKGGQHTLKIKTESDSVEFQTLVDSFNILIEQIMDLKIQYYEKKISLLDAEQKYIRLQLRPHYFLNALTTIVGLSRAGENTRIESYINALSKNVRYMFSSGLHTVPLADELRHVENYFKMQELKYPDSVLYFIDLSEEAKQWPVPQMLIHTVVENEYKYAVNANSQLMILIKASVVREGEEPLLLIEIEDNGKGYPDSVIHAINDPRSVHEDDGTRVGLWSIRRLLELMYDRQGLFKLSNAEPHGAMNRIYIPEHPVHQRGETNVEKII